LPLKNSPLSAAISAALFPHFSKTCYTRDMKNLPRIIGSIAIIFGLIYGLYYAGTKGWLANTPLKNLDFEKLNFLSQGNLDQTKVVSSRVKEAGEHVQEVLGDQIEVDETAEKQPLHEKTIEYARYLYCQQVVNEYEQEP